MKKRIYATLFIILRTYTSNGTEKSKPSFYIAKTAHQQTGKKLNEVNPKTRFRIACETLQNPLVLTYPLRVLGYNYYGVMHTLYDPDYENTPTQILWGLLASFTDTALTTIYFLHTLEKNVVYQKELEAHAQQGTVLQQQNLGKENRYHAIAQHVRFKPIDHHQ